MNTIKTYDDLYSDFLRDCGLSYPSREIQQEFLSQCRRFKEAVCRVQDVNVEKFVDLSHNIVLDDQTNVLLVSLAKWLIENKIALGCREYIKF